MDAILDLPGEYMHWRYFALSLAGVTRRNEDGESRQSILKYCSDGQPVLLARDLDNELDRFAIAVLTATGTQIGWIPAGDYSLAMHIDRGGKVSAKILRMFGGPYADEPGCYGCVLEIGKYVTDAAKLAPFHKKALAIKSLIDEAKDRERRSQCEAIGMYWRAMRRIRALRRDPVACRLWMPNYPVNRLTLLLERAKRYEDCINAINWWKNTRTDISKAEE
jgi:hypothetical protein